MVSIDYMMCRQRDYLEKTVDSLKHKLQKDMEQHRTENVRIMQVSHNVKELSYAHWQLPYAVCRHKIAADMVALSAAKVQLGSYAVFSRS